MKATMGFRSNKRRASSSFGSRFVASFLWLLQDSNSSFVSAASDEKFGASTPSYDDFSAAELFATVPEIHVNGPSIFPKPTRKVGGEGNVEVVVEPTLGQHRRTSDAILAYAEGYQLSYYQMFLETLTATGYRGDVVLAIAEERIIRPYVVDYLETYTRGDTDKPNVVIYQHALDCDIPDGSGLLPGQRHVTKSGDTNGFQMCRLPHVYGWKNDDGEVIRTASDPRRGRVVATLRYEWYWIWSQYYSPTSWLLLIDARDSFFQSDPFLDLPRRNSEENPKQGLLYFFGENANATRLGISTKNQKWIRNAYGAATINALKEKPTICSGSTMGEQVALDQYLRALVNEHDENTIKMAGSDQGFHNYLYYSNKLGNVEAIERIVVWEQGRGMVNNLGALRTKALSEWKQGNRTLYDPNTYRVFQWYQHEEILSPVVHQFDRDKHLFTWMVRKKHPEWQKSWEKKHGKK